MSREWQQIKTRKPVAHIWEPWVRFSWPNAQQSLCGKSVVADPLYLDTPEDDVKHCKACEKKLKTDDHEPSL